MQSNLFDVYLSNFTGGTRGGSFGRGRQQKKNVNDLMHSLSLHTGTGHRKTDQQRHLKPPPPGVQQANPSKKWTGPGPSIRSPIPGFGANQGRRRHEENGLESKQIRYDVNLILSEDTSVFEIDFKDFIDIFGFVQ